MCPCRQPSGKIPPCRQSGRQLLSAWLVLLIFVIVVGIQCVFTAGCARAVQKPRIVVPKPNAAPIVAGQLGKDATIIAEAANIDALAPEARPHTDAQRAAVAAAPAQDVAKLAADYEATIKGLQAQIADLVKQNAKLAADLLSALNATDKVIRIGGYALAGLLVAAGVASFFLMAQLAFLGPNIGYALIAAGGSVFAMMQAYDWTKAHPYITGVTLLLLAVAGALAFANHHHDKAKS